MADPNALSPEEEEFFDICDLVERLSSDLNRYNISKYRNTTIVLDAHEQAIYSLHINHVLDFCKVLQSIVSTVGPNRPAIAQPETPDESQDDPSQQQQQQQHQQQQQQQQQQSSSSSSSAAIMSPTAGPSGENGNSSDEPQAERVYLSGMDFAMTGDMDINIRKGDRIQMALTMENGMALGSNMETGATGTFPIACLTSGTLVPVGQEDVVRNDRNNGIDGLSFDQDGNPIIPPGQQQPPPVGAPGSAGVGPSRVHTVNTDVSSPPVSTSSPRRRGTQNDNGSNNFSALPYPNPLNRSIGRHIAVRAYQSGSVLEASLERGDEVEVMFWEDDEMAVGIHIPSQSEALFRGSMLQYVGTQPQQQQDAASVSSSAGIARVTPVEQGRVVEIPAEVGVSERVESLALQQQQRQQQQQQYGGVGSSAAGMNGGYAGPEEAELANSDGAGTLGHRLSILAQGVQFQQNDASQYKTYLESLDNAGYGGAPTSAIVFPGQQQPPAPSYGNMPQQQQPQQQFYNASPAMPQQPQQQQFGGAPPTSAIAGMVPPRTSSSFPRGGPMGGTQQGRMPSYGSLEPMSPIQQPPQMGMQMGMGMPIHQQQIPQQPQYQQYQMPSQTGGYQANINNNGIVPPPTMPPPGMNPIMFPPARQGSGSMTMASGNMIGGGSSSSPAQGGYMSSTPAGSVSGGSQGGTFPRDDKYSHDRNSSLGGGYVFGATINAGPSGSGSGSGSGNGFGGPVVELTEQQQKRITGAKHVIAELHATEENYVNLLQVFKERVIEPLREARILSTVDIDRAFKHLQPIYDLSLKVEKYLRAAKDTDTGDANLIVDVFLTKIEREEWKVYESYIENYQPAKQIVSKMLQRED
ncbi:hypothetical protein HDU76_004476 [Blyttiomyces sp. JEL0837]|nr:hypothetical protein HDU76_004476 [Blyttiomyces sp. JEL0837]